MNSRRAALPELSAYRQRRRYAFPWRATRWGHVAIGFALVGLPTAAIIVALIGWMG